MDFSNLLCAALAMRASDIFLAAGKRPAFRCAGQVIHADEFPDAPGAEDMEQFRTGAIDARREEHYRQTGSCDAAITVAERRFRVNFFNAQGSCGAVIRPLRHGGELDCAELNLPDALTRFASARRGLILVAGAAGNGKSTAMNAMVHFINRNFARHIVTVEDPVEYLHDDLQSIVTQREVNSDTASFAGALRSVVRESPDVIVIGEMRDTESMTIALSAALTGHLVLSTIHTANAVQALERIINAFPAEQHKVVADDLASALVGVAAVRLAPRRDESGMIPAVELMGMTPRLRKLIADRDFAAIDAFLRQMRHPDFQSFNRALTALVKADRVAWQDALELSSPREEFLLLARGMESGINTFRTLREDDETEEGENTLDMKRLLHTAVRHGASDLILSCGSAPVLRLNGELAPLDSPPLTAFDTQHLLYSLLSDHQREEFETRREIDFALSVAMNMDGSGPAQDMRFRINGFHQRGTVGAAVRVIAGRIPDAAELNLPDALLQMITKRQGLLLVTGPTGHGKSTTLACLLEIINRTRACHIITIEDPIEYVHSNRKAVVEQRELYADTLSFAAALKYALRQDPDVILVGEMRDPETVAAALTAAETGHLVMSTLHTNNAAQTVDRIVDSFPAHQQNQIRVQLSGALLGVVAQRLIPRADGQGRVAAFEVMTATTAIRALIRDGKTNQIQSVLETSSKDGMVTLEKALQELHRAGQIAREEYQSLLRSFRDTHGI